jgi:hypothetical protein
MSQPEKARPRSKTPAERSEEFAAHQAKLKAEAQERRKTATTTPKPPRPQSHRRG